MNETNTRLRLLMAAALASLLLFAALIALAMVRGTGAPNAGSANIATQGFAGSLIPKGFEAPEFRLRDQDGEPVSMREYRGRPLLVTFAYSVCEESCPAQLQLMRHALDELEEPIPALAISVDPTTDTPDSARKFLLEQRVPGQVDFVLGSRRELAPVWKGFAIQPQTDDLEHHARVVLIDAAGDQRLGYSVDGVTAEQLADDIRRLSEGIDPALERPS